MKIYQSDKNNAFFGVGDTISVTLNNGERYCGKITCIDIRKQQDELYPVIDIRISDEPPQEASFFIYNVNKLEIIKFSGELEN